MRLDRGLFHDPAMTFPSRVPEGPYTCDSDRFLPQKVADVPKDVIKNFPHTKRVGNYYLGKTLGEGSFAKVKESIHILTGEKVAIKVIDKKKAKEDAYVRKNMRREGKILQMVRHSHVVQLYEIMETENSYYLVTELCRGGDLMDYICTKKKLDEKEAKRFIREIISAVQYLHSAGILHRDLKVENLLLDENKHIKIIDFGLSNAVRTSPSKEGSIAQEFCVTQCGSPAYAAPELLGNKKYGPPVDIWSIGINMYAMLTGNLPFTVEPFNIKTLHQKMLNGDMNAMPETLSKNGKDFLKRLLTADPEKRISLRDALSHPWITDAQNNAMEPAPFPNKLNADDLHTDILKHMSQNLDYRLSETIRLVSNNVPSAATSTYHMFHRKLNRYNAEMRVQGKMAATDVQLTSASRSTQNTSGYISRDDVIDLIPVSNTTKDTKGRNICDVKEDVLGTPNSEKQPAVTTVQLSTGVSPVRILQRQAYNTRNNTFHGQETPASAQNANITREVLYTEEHVATMSNPRPYTTKDKSTQEGNGDVKVFRLPASKEFARKQEPHKMWSNPQVKKSSTNETKTSDSSDVHTDRPRFANLPGDLPAIAEKTPANEDDRPTYRSKTLRSPLFIRKSVKPTSNYSFRPRGAFSDMEAQAAANRNPGIVPKPGMPTCSNVGSDRRSIGPEPTVRLHDPQASPDQFGSVSEPFAKTQRHRSVTGNKVLPRKVLIDVGHYERYSRRNGDELPGQIEPHSTETMLANRKPMSCLYPMHTKAANRQTNRNFRAYQNTRLAGQGAELNITGERTGVNGTRVSAPIRDTWPSDKVTSTAQECDVIKYTGHGSTRNKVSHGDELPMTVHVHSKGPKEPGPASGDNTEDTGVILPVITPTVINSND